MNILGTYPRTVAASHRLMISHSSEVAVKTKQRDSEVVFGQTYINGKAGYVTRRGSCHICKEEGHHSWECKNKKKTDKVPKKKDDDGKLSISDTSSIPTTVGSNVKKETQVLASGTETGTNNDSNHDVFEITFCALGGELTAGTSSVIKELEDTSGQDDSPISKTWIVLDSQSTVNCFCEEKYLDNTRQVESTVLIRCNGGV